MFNITKKIGVFSPSQYGSSLRTNRHVTVMSILACYINDIYQRRGAVFDVCEANLTSSELKLCTYARQSIAKKRSPLSTSAGSSREIRQSIRSTVSVPGIDPQPLTLCRIIACTALCFRQNQFGGKTPIPIYFSAFRSERPYIGGALQQQRHRLFRTEVIPLLLYFHLSMRRWLSCHSTAKSMLRSEA